MTVTPHQAAADVFDRAERLLILSRYGQDELIAGDVARSVLALSVAGLDTYFHWAIADVPLKSIPNSLRKLEIPFGELIDLSEAVVSNRGAIRPKVRARNILERTIVSRTFQSPRGITEALAMLGVKKPFAALAQMIDPSQTASEIEAKLGHIVHRRNQIVHEGDLRHPSRPRTIRRESISPDQAQNDLQWLRSLVDAIDRLLRTNH